jgi:glycerate 2-kinase
MRLEDFLTQTLKAQPWGSDVASILSAAIEAVDPFKATSDHLNLTGDQLHIGHLTYPLRKFERVIVVGAGKAGLPMAEAVYDRLGQWITSGLVIVKEGYGGRPEVGPIEIREAGHPIPDGRGLAATEDLVGMVSEAGANDLVLVLISGGGSALLTRPVSGVSLEDLQMFTDLLLRSGAEIGEINRLRQRLDRVKGGGLARQAAPAKLAALILSDVVGDPLDLIASGPTVLPPIHKQSSMEFVRNYDLEDRLPESIRSVLRRQSPPPFMLKEPNNILVGNNELAARAAMEQAERLGFQTELITTTLTGEAREVGELYSQRLLAYSSAGGPRPAMWVAGGETTVTVQGKGTGGRNQEVALAAVSGLAGLDDIALVTLATDGGDGPTEAAGAVVTGETFSRAREQRLAPLDFLENNDSYTFFQQLGDCLIPGPTKTNVNDLLFLFYF